MAYSSILTDYLGQGTAASRPSSLSIASGALGIYYAYDTNVTYLWDTNTSAWVTLASGGGGGGSGTVTTVVAGTGLAGGTITVSGTVSLAAIATATVLANPTGSSAAPAATTVSALLDYALGSTQGDILYRGASNWGTLAPGTSGQALVSGGVAANPSWSTLNTLGSIATASIYANISGSAAVPSAHTLTAVLDSVFGSTQGDILYRNSTTWTVLAPGTNGQVLTTAGSGGNPSWAAGSGLPSGADGTVLSNISGGATTPSLNQLSAVLDHVFGSTQGGTLYRGASAWNFLSPGTSGYVLTAGGGAANPSWAAIPGATGTVTSLVAGAGLSGGTITTTGTIALAAIGAGDIIANTGTASGVPTGVSLSAILDADVSSTQGTMLYRGASGWVGLPPSTSGNVLQTNGSGANPTWVLPSGLPSAADGTVVANISGATTQPVSAALTAVLDHVFGSAQGDILYRGATGWQALTPGTAGQFLKTGGTGAGPSWAAAGGTGTVTQIVAGPGLAGGTITTSGTVSIATQAANTILANLTGSSATPAGSTLSAILDAVLSSAEGAIIYRGPAAWSALPAGTAGQFLQTGGVSAAPAWATVAGSGTVTSVVAGAGLGGGTITTTGTLTLGSITNGTVLANTAGSAALPVGTTISALLDATVTATQGSLIFRSAAGWAGLGPGTGGYYLQTAGAGANPSWQPAAGGGTVTQVVAGTGLSGGTITGVGTIALAGIAAGDVLANTAGSLTAPIGVSLTSLIDSAIGSTEGDILYRGASAWSALAPGTAGQLLASGGSGAVPSWTSAGYGALPAEVQKLPLGYVIPGLPGSSAVLNLVMAMAVTIPANLAGTVTYDGTLPTSSAIFTLNKISGGTTTAVATITLLTSGHTAATLSTQAQISLSAGDVLQLQAPATQDVTLADVGITVLAMRT